jgi:hypothetical protein
MRNPRLTTTVLAATASVIVGALSPLSAQSQQQKSAPPPAQAQQPAQPQPDQQQPDQQAPSPPQAYKPVAVQLPKPLTDPSFEAFRQQIVAIAQKKDRTGLARLVARNFFWMPEDQDAADKRKSGIDNLAKAIGLEGRDAAGWELLATFANEPTADPNAERPGVVCAPGEPNFDENAAEELVNTTQTDPSEWGYPTKDGVEVRSEPSATSQVTEKLGLHLVRAYPDDSPANAVQADFLRIVTPSGKLGFVQVDSIAALASDQLCYVKEGNAWKIAGVIGGATP